MIFSIKKYFANSELTGDEPYEFLRQKMSKKLSNIYLFEQNAKIQIYAISE